MRERGHDPDPQLAIATEHDQRPDPLAERGQSHEEAPTVPGLPPASRTKTGNREPTDPRAPLYPMVGRLEVRVRLLGFAVVALFTVATIQAAVIAAVVVGIVVASW